MQIGKLNRHVNELTEDLRVRDDLLRTAEAEKDSLNEVNAELRERNIEQQQKIEMCEHDVNGKHLFCINLFMFISPCFADMSLVLLSYRNG